MSLDDDPAQNKPIDSTKLIEVELPTYLIGKIEARQKRLKTWSSYDTALYCI